MNKFTKFLLKILIPLLIFSSIGVAAYVKLATNNTNEKPVTNNANEKSTASVDPNLTKYVQSTIKDFISKFKECTWNSSSKMDHIITLYDLDYNINGYIFDITTNGTESGFVEIDCSTDNNIISSFSFAGKHSLNSMLTAYKKQHVKSTYPELNKIIYLGSYNYLINNYNSKTNKYYSLSSQSEIKETYTTLKNDYIRNVKRKMNSNP
ncbi:hypothetical protein [Candidatus Clostridium radicumherbarum]|uniref:Secreted protein n=1 Tax=Candidatus Clostridium radicumherbarum TaxID=3381662 RepID=A0ABW8TTZ1_9CLOT